VYLKHQIEEYQMRIAPLFLGFVFLQAPVPPSPSPQLASIEGMVVRSDTKEALVNARITLTKIQQNPNTNTRIAPTEVTTDKSGRFLLKDLEAGSYRMFAVRNGFARQDYGQRTLNRPGTTVVLAAGQKMDDVVFSLVPAATVSGRVLDEEGQPIPAIEVQLLRRTYAADGKPSYAPVGNALTNDLGDYRLFWASPGRYYLNVTGTPSPMIRMRNANLVPLETYVPTYYPGTDDPSAASLVELRPGDQLVGYDFILRRSVTATLRGRIINPTNQPTRNVFLSLTPRRFSGGFISSTNRSSYHADGTFEVRDVPPGQYFLHARSGSPGADPLVTQAAVDVADKDIDGINLVFNPGFDITGQIYLEGGNTAGAVDVGSMRVLLRPADENIIFGAPMPTIKPDGSFIITRVQPTNYRLMVVGIPPDAFLKDARIGNDSVLENLEVTGPIESPLNILIGANAGQIDGTVTDDKGNPVTTARVVLIPNAFRRARTELYRQGALDQFGRFNMRGIAPGEYRLFAWEDIETGEYFDPDFLREHEPRGTPLTIKEGSKENVTLRVIPAN
jgi:hypothetical protein